MISSYLSFSCVAHERGGHLVFACGVGTLKSNIRSDLLCTDSACDDEELISDHPSNSATIH